MGDARGTATSSGLPSATTGSAAPTRHAAPAWPASTTASRHHQGERLWHENRPERNVIRISLNGPQLPVGQAVFPVLAARSRLMSDSFKTESVSRTHYLHHDDHEHEEGQP